MYQHMLIDVYLREDDVAEFKAHIDDVRVENGTLVIKIAGPRAVSLDDVPDYARLGLTMGTEEVL